MPYKIITGTANDIGANSEASIQQAIDSLIKSVEAAEAEGWEPIGGHQVTLRQRPHGHLVVASQSVRKRALPIHPDVVAAFANGPLFKVEPMTIPVALGPGPQTSFTSDPSANNPLYKVESANDTMAIQRPKDRPEHREKNAKVAAAAKSAISGNTP